MPLVVRVNPRARRMSLRVCAATRSARLTVPVRTPRRAAFAFLEEYEGWVCDQAQRRVAITTPFEPGARIPLGDSELLLENATGISARQEGDRLLVPGSNLLFAGRVRRWLLAEARRRLEQPTIELAQQIGRDDVSVRFGDYRSRWGSCAADGRIAYSWRLVLAPVHVQQAVIAHEVAHLAEPNHSPRFWAVATELLGRPHTEARAWLKANGPALHAIGR